MRIGTRIICTLIPAALLLVSNAMAAPSWAGHEELQDGILTIFNPTTPDGPVNTLLPRLEWRLGDDDSDLILGHITDLQRTPEGTTYLLDVILSTVYEISPAGEVRRTLGREGDGPGEFRNAVSLVLLPEHNLGIVELMPSHMVVLGPDGLDRPGFDLSGGEASQSNVENVAVNGNALVMGLYGMDFAAGVAEISQTLGVFNLDGSLRHRVLYSSEKQSGRSASSSTGEDNDFLNNWSLGANGKIAVYGHRQEYLIEIFDLEGQPVRHIRRRYKSVRRPEQELAEQRARHEELRQRFRTVGELKIEEMAPDIGNVIIRPNGWLWVLSSRGSRDCPTDQVGIFDVFDQNGRFQSQLSLVADYNPDDDQYLLRGNHLYILKEANNAPERTITSGGGQMMMVMLGDDTASDPEEEDEEPKPYEVICYELPAGY